MFSLEPTVTPRNLQTDEKGEKKHSKKDIYKCSETWYCKNQMLF